jgi:hypothetical protein
MPAFLTNEFFLFLVGTVGVGAFYVPWQGNRFQDRQREIGVRTSLVAEMSRCVMTFDTELKHRARSAWAASQRLTSGGDRATSDTNPSFAADATLAFDVTRCVIGTELEAYFPGLTIAEEWDRFAGLFIKFSQLPVIGREDYAEFATELAAFPLGEDERDRAISDATMVRDRDPAWARVENLLLAEKLRLIKRVLSTEMPKLKRIKGSPR